MLKAQSGIGRARGGYIFLVTILVIGAIATAASVSLMLLGWAAEQNGRLLTQSATAFEYANICAERALRQLRIDPSYAGETTVTFDQGSCLVETIAGSGNDERVLCIDGRSGDTVRRLEIELQQLFPTVKVTSWQEVSTFTLCL